ncbi:MAG: adenosylhomocysteinase, partial [Peptococcaceae bacterium]|nr:adenosylhomocysteinase [Peptococcaceae bacterium]
LGDFFLTVTGDKKVITEEHFAVMKDKAILANAGHFDVEIDKEALNNMCVKHGHTKPNIEEYHFADGRKVYLLGEGRLVNLAAGDGHPAEIMDLTFALQALSLEYVLNNPGLANTVHSVPKEIDERVAKIKLQALNVSIDALTAEQQEYLSSWQL